VEHYATYILHLEKALEAVDEALSTVNPALSNKNNKKMDKDVLRERKRVAKLIMKLEEQAAQRGESGLAICLSKPFQRLLKYPLLFQALLYQWVPSLAPAQVHARIKLTTSLQHGPIYPRIRDHTGYGPRDRCHREEHRERKDQRG
jgi:hypothetical protein